MLFNFYWYSRNHPPNFIGRTGNVLIDPSLKIAETTLTSIGRYTPRPYLIRHENQIGRLLIMTRQMDMLMVDEAAVAGYAAKFLNGEYH